VFTEDWGNRSFEALGEEFAMKAAQVVKYGDAVEGIELREIPEPAAPKSGEALVGVECYRACRRRTNDVERAIGSPATGRTRSKLVFMVQVHVIASVC